MGIRFHADLHIAAAAAADPARADGTLQGGTLLYDPAGDGLLITRVMISTDAAMRVAVGMADQDSRRVRAGYFAANGGAAPDACWQGPPGGKLYVFRGAQGNVDVSIDGELLSSGG
jgi:hypothetical protein